MLNFTASLLLLWCISILTSW